MLFIELGEQKPQPQFPSQAFHGNQMVFFQSSQLGNQAVEASKQEEQGESLEESTKEASSQVIEDASESKDSVVESTQQILTKKASKESVKSAAKNYDKNICRYLVRCSIRSFINEKYQKLVMQLCGNSESQYDGLVNYFTKNMERITGFRVLKQYLIVTESDT